MVAAADLLGEQDRARHGERGEGRGVETSVPVEHEIEGGRGRRHVVEPFDHRDAERVEPFTRHRHVRRPAFDRHRSRGQRCEPGEEAAAAGVHVEQEVRLPHERLRAFA